MNHTPFFLTPHQGDNASVRVSQDSFQPGAGPETREAIERVEAGLGLHGQDRTGFSLNVTSFQRAFTDDKGLKMTHTKTGRPE
jgi:hypothetical protein